MSSPAATGPVCVVHGTPMPGGRACVACILMPPSDESEAPGFYEAATDDARRAGVPDRIEAERILWERHTSTMRIADAIGAEAAQQLGRDRAMLLALQLKAIDIAGKDARHAASMILWRERMCDAEKADRLYREQQRKVGRARA